MNVTYTDRVQDWPEAFALAQKATERLAEILKEDVDEVSGEWDTAEGERGPELSLRVRDADGEAENQIRLNELREKPRTSIFLYGLWGDLLHHRSKKILQQILANAENS